MSKPLARCSNPACKMHMREIVWNGTEDHCPICGSVLVEVDDEDDGVGGTASDNWLETIAKDDTYWKSGADQKYPSVIAYKYRALREYCKKKEPYAVLLCLKDNFESLLKLEVLFAFAWAENHASEAIRQNTICQIVTPNLSLGAWQSFLSLLIKDLHNAGITLPDVIPLEKIRKEYESAKIVKWRNDQIGHGAMSLSDDEVFRKDIYEKITLLKSIYEKLDKELSAQELYTYAKAENESAAEKVPCEPVILNGADKARDLPFSGLIYFRTTDLRINICVHPFIVMYKNESDKYGIYFYDNQKSRTLTHFLAYSDGRRAGDEWDYFQRLRILLKETGVNPEIQTNSMFLTEEEHRLLELPQMSHEFVKPDYLVEWVQNCLDTYDKGVFLLRMDRGTGKSVFTEHLNCLYDNAIRLRDDVDARVYHFNRTQSAGADDFCDSLEWQWRNQYEGRDWRKAKTIESYEKKGEEPDEALISFLSDIQKMSSKSRGYNRILTVFDGLDEANEEYLWKYIPGKDRLKRGMYILLTSRNPETEELPEGIKKRLRQLSVTAALSVERSSDENIYFLQNYIKNTDLSKWSKEEIKLLIEQSDNRILFLGMLCRLVENGLPIKKIPDYNEIVRVYLETLEKKHGEKGGNQLRELLALLCTLGRYEAISTDTLAALTGEEGLTLQLWGRICDLAPMLKVERNETGNRYCIANPDLLSELRKQIKGIDEYVFQMAQTVSSIMKEGELESNPGLKAAAAHIVELVLDSSLPDARKQKVLGGLDIALLSVIEKEEKSATYYYERDRVLNYKEQLYLFNYEKYGKLHKRTIWAQNELAIECSHRGRYAQASQLILEVDDSVKKFGEWNNIVLISHLSKANVFRNMGRYEEAKSLYEEVQAKAIAKEDDNLILKVKEGLAMLHKELGNIDLAEQMQKGVIPSLKSIYGEKAQPVMAAQLKLASIKNEAGEKEEAIRLVKEVYDVRVQKLGLRSPETIETQIQYGIILANSGYYKKAKQTLQDAYEQAYIILGPNHPSTLDAKDMIEKIPEAEDLEPAIISHNNEFEMYNRRLIMKVPKNEVYYWTDLGFKLGKLEFLWGSPYDFAIREFEGTKNEILSSIEPEISIDDSSFQVFCESILNYYKENNVGQYCYILVGIAIKRAGLLNSAKTKEKKIEITRLVYSAIAQIPALDDKEKSDLYNRIVNNYDKSFEEITNLLYDQICTFYEG